MDNFAKKSGIIKRMVSIAVLKKNSQSIWVFSRGGGEGKRKLSSYMLRP
jgi:hypothetical protein